MTNEVISCDVEASVGDVARMMKDKNVGCVVVVDGGKVAGIVTDRQLACHVLADNKGADTSISEVMTKDPVCATLDDNLFNVLDTLKTSGMVRRVPVVDRDGKLAGIVSISDIAAIAKEINDVLLMEELRNSTAVPKVFTGAQRLEEEISRDRRPIEARR